MSQEDLEKNNLIEFFKANFRSHQHLIDEILLEVLLQCCGNQEGTEIDNQCLSAFEDACDYLTERGYIKTLNGRIYTINKK
ncbi:MAG: hypothetical protein IMZ51_03805 [Chloroflexi bacterium]|nr:hypothetical protein [Chloroflexota bacterium]